MKITIVFDNETAAEGLAEAWGFSCLVQAHGVGILFDTGADGGVLLGNMKQLGIEPAVVDEVFISHDHRDHTGGLAAFLAMHPVPCYIPSVCREPEGAPKVVKVGDPLEIHEGIYSTGELSGFEQSLVIDTGAGVAVVVGCSHPGVGKILEAASMRGVPRALIGGLHGFRDFDRLRELDLICPAHCTQARSEIARLYPGKHVAGGVGTVIEL
jgi:7,8-dihydropterin-6-yl-methyl-4-(beta-D-ribofuranosyl)aminobenzene 5'-phosphate synthase